MSKKGKLSGNCEICGEFIPFAVRRSGWSEFGAIICCECYGEPLGHNTGRGDCAATADHNYHGSRFHSAEW